MDNTSGIFPTGYQVLVKIDAVEEKTAAGIILPPQIVEREQLAAAKGVLSAASPLAFGYERWPDGAQQPVVGTRVLIRKFGGVDIKGDDGADYRVCEDKDILATLAG